MVRLWLKKLLEKHEAHAARPNLHFRSGCLAPSSEECRWQALAPAAGQGCTAVLILAFWESGENRRTLPHICHPWASFPWEVLVADLRAGRAVLPVFPSAGTSGPLLVLSPEDALPVICVLGAEAFPWLLLTGLLQGCSFDLFTLQTGKLRLRGFPSRL